MASSIVGSNWNGLHIKPRMSQTISWNSITKLDIQVPKDQTLFACNNNKRKFVVHPSSEPGDPLPSEQPSSSPRSWILGLLASLVLPFVTHKWGPLWLLKNRMESGIETVEQIVEVVEKVAEEVDKIAEDIADDLPEGKLKNIVDIVEDVAEKTAKSADSVEHFIDKVHEAEDKVESFIESLNGEAKKSSKQAKKL
ncbi:unnamed protein product [Fraxinus pennsylvanica]|uniref:Uncharacterized protein n=1 Tax=Fraxinus pennsylvanica TaxID=56036 RepID=A0AAD2E470_9LAMI|nr:unnamed protein product [Fraxinus pennsylvanica]